MNPRTQANVVNFLRKLSRDLVFTAPELWQEKFELKYSDWLQDLVEETKDLPAIYEESGIKEEGQGA